VGKWGPKVAKIAGRKQAKRVTERVRRAQLIAAGAAGGTVGVGHGFEEARAHDITGIKMLGHVLLMGGWGLTESLPIMKVFGRLGSLAGKAKGSADVTTKGPIGFLGKLMLGANRKTLQAGLVGALEEGSQELLQGWGSNLSAKMFIDSERDLLDGLAEGGATGAVIGALFNVVGIRLGKIGRAKRLATIKGLRGEEARKFVDNEASKPTTEEDYQDEPIEDVAARQEAAQAIIDRQDRHGAGVGGADPQEQADWRETDEFIDVLERQANAREDLRERAEAEAAQAGKPTRYGETAAGVEREAGEAKDPTSYSAEKLAESHEQQRVAAIKLEREKREKPAKLAKERKKLVDRLASAKRSLSKTKDKGSHEAWILRDLIKETEDQLTEQVVRDVEKTLEDEEALEALDALGDSLGVPSEPVVDEATAEDTEEAAPSPKVEFTGGKDYNAWYHEQKAWIKKRVAELEAEGDTDPMATVRKEISAKNAAAAKEADAKEAEQAAPSQDPETLDLTPGAVIPYYDMHGNRHSGRVISVNKSTYRISVRDAKGGITEVDYSKGGHRAWGVGKDWRVSRDKNSFSITKPTDEKTGEIVAEEVAPPKETEKEAFERRSREKLQSLMKRAAELKAEGDTDPMTTAVGESIDESVARAEEAMEEAYEAMEESDADTKKAEEAAPDPTVAEEAAEDMDAIREEREAREARLDADKKRVAREKAASQRADDRRKRRDKENVPKPQTEAQRAWPSPVIPGLRSKRKGLVLYDNWEDAVEAAQQRGYSLDEADIAEVEGGGFQVFGPFRQRRKMNPAFILWPDHEDAVQEALDISGLDEDKADIHEVEGPGGERGFQVFGGVKARRGETPGEPQSVPPPGTSPAQTAAEKLKVLLRKVGLFSDQRTPEENANVNALLKRAREEQVSQRATKLPTPIADIEGILVFRNALDAKTYARQYNKFTRKGDQHSKKVLTITGMNIVAGGEQLAILEKGKGSLLTKERLSDLGRRVRAAKKLLIQMRKQADASIEARAAFHAQVQRRGRKLGRKKLEDVKIRQAELVEHLRQEEEARKKHVQQFMDSTIPEGGTLTVEERIRLSRIALRLTELQGKDDDVASVEYQRNLSTARKRRIIGDAPVPDGTVAVVISDTAVELDELDEVIDERTADLMSELEKAKRGLDPNNAEDKKALQALNRNTLKELNILSEQGFETGGSKEQREAIIAEGRGDRTKQTIAHGLLTRQGFTNVQIGTTATMVSPPVPISEDPAERLKQLSDIRVRTVAAEALREEGYDVRFSSQDAIEIDLDESLNNVIGYLSELGFVRSQGKGLVVKLAPATPDNISRAKKIAARIPGSAVVVGEEGPIPARIKEELASARKITGRSDKYSQDVAEIRERELEEKAALDKKEAANAARRITPEQRAEKKKNELFNDIMGKGYGRNFENFRLFIKTSMDLPLTQMDDYKALEVGEEIPESLLDKAYEGRHGIKETVESAEKKLSKEQYRDFILYLWDNFNKAQITASLGADVRTVVGRAESTGFETAFEPDPVEITHEEKPEEVAGPVKEQEAPSVVPFDTLSSGDKTKERKAIRSFISLVEDILSRPKGDVFKVTVTSPNARKFVWSKVEQRWDVPEKKRKYKTEQKVELESNEYIGYVDTAEEARLMAEQLPDPRLAKSGEYSYEYTPGSKMQMIHEPHIDALMNILVETYNIKNEIEIGSKYIKSYMGNLAARRSGDVSEAELADAFGEGTEKAEPQEVAVSPVPETEEPKEKKVVRFFSSDEVEKAAGKKTPEEKVEEGERKLRQLTKEEVIKRGERRRRKALTNEDKRRAVRRKRTARREKRPGEETPSIEREITDATPAQIEAKKKFLLAKARKRRNVLIGQIQSLPPDTTLTAAGPVGLNKSVPGTSAKRSPSVAKWARKPIEDAINEKGGKIALEKKAANDRFDDIVIRATEALDNAILGAETQARITKELAEKHGADTLPTEMELGYDNLGHTYGSIADIRSSFVGDVIAAKKLELENINKDRAKALEQIDSRAKLSELDPEVAKAVRKIEKARLAMTIDERIREGYFGDSSMVEELTEAAAEIGREGDVLLVPKGTEAVGVIIIHEKPKRSFLNDVKKVVPEEMPFRITTETTVRDFIGTDVSERRARDIDGNLGKPFDVMNQQIPSGRSRFFHGQTVKIEESGLFGVVSDIFPTATGGFIYDIRLTKPGESLYNKDRFREHELLEGTEKEQKPLKVTGVKKAARGTSTIPSTIGTAAQDKNLVEPLSDEAIRAVGGVSIPFEVSKITRKDEKRAEKQAKSQATRASRKAESTDAGTEESTEAKLVDTGKTGKPRKKKGKKSPVTTGNSNISDTAAFLRDMQGKVSGQDMQVNFGVDPTIIVDIVKASLKSGKAIAKAGSEYLRSLGKVFKSVVQAGKVLVAKFGNDIRKHVPRIWSAFKKERQRWPSWSEMWSAPYDVHPSLRTSASASMLRSDPRSRGIAINPLWGFSGSDFPGKLKRLWDSFVKPKTEAPPPDLKKDLGDPDLELLDAVLGDFGLPELPPKPDDSIEDPKEEEPDKLETFIRSIEDNDRMSLNIYDDFRKDVKKAWDHANAVIKFSGEDNILKIETVLARILDTMTTSETSEDASTEMSDLAHDLMDVLAATGIKELEYTTMSERLIGEMSELNPENIYSGFENDVYEAINLANNRHLTKKKITDIMSISGSLDDAQREMSDLIFDLKLKSVPGFEKDIITEEGQQELDEELREGEDLWEGIDEFDEDIPGPDEDLPGPDEDLLESINELNKDEKKQGVSNGFWINPNLHDIDQMLATQEGMFDPKTTKMPGNTGVWLVQDEKGNIYASWYNNREKLEQSLEAQGIEITQQWEVVHDLAEGMLYEAEGDAKYIQPSWLLTTHMEDKIFYKKGEWDESLGETVAEDYIYLKPEYSESPIGSFARAINKGLQVHGVNIEWLSGLTHKRLPPGMWGLHGDITLGMGISPGMVNARLIVAGGVNFLNNIRSTIKTITDATKALVGKFGKAIRKHVPRIWKDFREFSKRERHGAVGDVGRARQVSRQRLENLRRERVDDKGPFPGIKRRRGESRRAFAERTMKEQTGRRTPRRVGRMPEETEGQQVAREGARKMEEPDRWEKSSPEEWERFDRAVHARRLAHGPGHRGRANWPWREGKSPYVRMTDYLESKSNATSEFTAIGKAARVGVSAIRGVGSVVAAGRRATSDVFVWYGDTMPERMRHFVRQNIKDKPLRSKLLAHADMIDRVIDKAKTARGELSSVLNPLLKLGGINNAWEVHKLLTDPRLRGILRGMEYLEANAQDLPSGGQISNLQLALEGQSDINMPKEAKELLHLISLINMKTAEMAREAGIRNVHGQLFLGRVAGAVRARIATVDMFHILMRKNDPAYNDMVTAFMEAHNLKAAPDKQKTYEQVKDILDDLSDKVTSPFSGDKVATPRDIGPEHLREFAAVPDYIPRRGGGKWTKLFETNPFHYGTRVVDVTSKRIGFVSEYGQGAGLVEGQRRDYLDSVAGGFPFDDAIKALVGIPVNAPLFDPGSTVGLYIDTANEMANVVKSGLVSVSVVVNAAEFLGNIPAFTGLNMYMRYMMLGRDDYQAYIKQAYAAGIMTKDLADLSTDADKPARSGLRRVAEILRTLNRPINEAQERVSAVIGLMMIDDMKKKRANSRYALTVMAMGFRKEDAKRITKGGGTDEEYGRIARFFPTLMVGQPSEAAERSKAWHGRVFKNMWAFQMYPMMKTRSIMRLGKAVGESLGNDPTPKDYFDSANLMSRYAFGTAAAGGAGYFMLSLMGGGLEGLRQAFGEAEEDPVEAVTGFLAFAMLGGPLQVIYRMIKEGNNYHWSEIIGRSMLPTFMMVEAYESLLGKGRYRNLDMMERLHRMGNTLVPATRMVETALVAVGVGDVLGFGGGKEGLRLKADMRAYYRWRNSRGMPKVVTLASSTDFGTHMRKAGMAVRTGQDPSTHILRALRGTDERTGLPVTPQRVASSIRGKKLLKGLRALEIQALIKRIGYEAYRRLLIHDNVLERWAKSMSNKPSSGKKPDRTLDFLIGSILGEN
jgi:hypothetical protein